VTKKRIHRQGRARKGRFTWLWAVVGVLLAAIGIWFSVGRNGQSTASPRVIGAPRLAVDQTTIDEGDVKLGKSIRSAFRLQNVGDEPLQILGEPVVEVVEGC
jgi:hypothetical protein